MEELSLKEQVGECGQPHLKFNFSFLWRNGPRLSDIIGGGGAYGWKFPRFFL